MRVALLGPLEVSSEQGSVVLAAAKQRALLELLALRAGQAVSAASLCNGLWGETEPPSAPKALQIYVSHLRRALPPDLLMTVNDGYCLRLDGGSVDSARFERDVRLSDERRRSGDFVASAALLRDSLGLWRGRPCPDLTEHSWASAEVVRFEEMRRAAQDELAEVRLALGHHALLVGELEAAVADEPLREQRWAHWVLALYRCGRQAEALRACSRLRQLLVEELGVNPSPMVRSLEEAVLRQDPALDWSGPGLDRGGHALQPGGGGAGPRLGEDLNVSGPVGTGPVLRHNLPGQASSFVGREAELSELSEALTRSRLVTITGAGGTGKTRLALQLATDLLDGRGDGVWLAELAPLADEELVAGQVAKSLGVAEQEGLAIFETLVEFMRPKRMLLLLDNCEHVISAVAKLVDRALRDCPGLHVVATSREPLGVGGETLYRLAPLTMPPPGTVDLRDVMLTESARLLVDRAVSSRSGFALDQTDAPVLASVCRRLDGIPLAIELAAARLQSMSLADLDQGLVNRFRLLTGGNRSALPRQRTLQATIDWSYDLLAPAERDVFCRLSVFNGDFDTEAAERVCGGDSGEHWEVLDRLSSLVQKSLLQADFSQSMTRYRLLETMKQYGATRLAGRDDNTEERAKAEHARVFRDRTIRARAERDTAAETRWLDRLRLDNENIRQALSYYLGTGDLADALAMATALSWYWDHAGHFSEGIAALQAALSSAEGAGAVNRARALSALGTLHSSRGERTAARSSFEKALALVPSDHEVTFRASVLASLANARYNEPEVAIELCNEAIADLEGNEDPATLSRALKLRGTLRRALGLPGAHEDVERALEVSRSMGSPIRTAGALANLAYVYTSDRDFHRARLYFDEALGLAVDLRRPNLVVNLRLNLGLACALDGELTEAQECYVLALATALEIEDSASVPYAIFGLSLCAAARGGDERAAAWLGASDRMLADRGEDFEALEAEVRQRLRDDLVRRMGPDAFEVSLAAGQSLSAEDIRALVQKERASGS